jgi:hypothetical protein
LEDIEVPSPVLHIEERFQTDRLSVMSASKSWSLELDQKLWGERGRSVSELAQEYCRTEGSIRARLEHLQDPTHDAYLRLSGQSGKIDERREQKRKLQEDKKVSERRQKRERDESERQQAKRARLDEKAALPTVATCFTEGCVSKITYLLSRWDEDDGPNVGYECDKCDLEKVYCKDCWAEHFGSFCGGECLRFSCEDCTPSYKYDVCCEMYCCIACAPPGTSWQKGTSFNSG